MIYCCYILEANIVLDAKTNATKEKEKFVSNKSLQ